MKIYRDIFGEEILVLHGFSQIDMWSRRFDPVSMLLIAGTGLITYGQIRSGQLAKAQGEAQNKIAEANARQLELERQSRMQAAHLEEERISRQARLFKGAQRARLAKSGLSITSGSAVEVQADTAYQTALDRLLTLQSGVVDSNRLKNQANIQIAEGKWAKSYGNQTANNAYISAAGTSLLGLYSYSNMATSPKSPTSSNPFDNGRGMRIP